MADGDARLDVDGRWEPFAIIQQGTCLIVYDMKLVDFTFFLRRWSGV